MQRGIYPWVFLLGGVLIGMIASGWISIQAQDRDQPGDARIKKEPVPVGTAGPVIAEAPAAISVQDALLLSYHFPFDRPTSLTQVCQHLKRTLGIRVVLDLAALDRQGVRPDDAVRLELEDVRLRTGLRLLLDQVRLTYRVVPEDNLLILTDRLGSEDPMDHIQDELKALHRDLHDVRDSVDDIADALYGEEEVAGPLLRKPTIIEETPEASPSAPVLPPSELKTPKPPERNPAEVHPPRGGRSRPSRIPLSARGRRSDRMPRATSTIRPRKTS